MGSARRSVRARVVVCDSAGSGMIVIVWGRIKLRRLMVGRLSVFGFLSGLRLALFKGGGIGRIREKTEVVRVFPVHLRGLHVSYVVEDRVYKLDVLGTGSALHSEGDTGPVLWGPSCKLLSVQAYTEGK